MTRVVPNPPAANANMNAQRNLNDAIKRDEKHNERVQKSLASLVDILSSCVGLCAFCVNVASPRVTNAEFSKKKKKTKKKTVT